MCHAPVVRALPPDSVVAVHDDDDGLKSAYSVPFVRMTPHPDPDARPTMEFLDVTSDGKLKAFASYGNFEKISTQTTYNRAKMGHFQQLQVAATDDSFTPLV